MRFRARTWIARLIGVAAALGLSGCITKGPPISYRKVDATTPEFQAEVAKEKAQLRAQGASESTAERKATTLAKQKAVETEKERRTREAAPLIAALADLDRSRGCWAFTVTTTRVRDQQATVTVEQYNPSQPQEKLWTLVSRNGKAPTDLEQEEYRARKKPSWRPQLMQRRRSIVVDPERVQRSVLFADFETTAKPDGTTEFVLNRGRYEGIGVDLAPSRRTYVVDPAAHALRRIHVEQLSGSSIVGMTVEYFDATIDFATIDPALPPFTTRTAARLRAHSPVSDTGAVEETVVYTDYRRVKCYEDRFEVQIGIPEVKDYLPGKD